MADLVLLQDAARYAPREWWAVGRDAPPKGARFSQAPALISGRRSGRGKARPWERGSKMGRSGVRGVPGPGVLGGHTYV